ncbi:GNAT family N-acetyltransferase [Aestuariivita sp.]|jgi:putative acetyltransferase|uniref:GNAT family N-acetyltransferase n=1 Tax=Aestuariivita sp. TaxID=1872407 RepID=UPI0025B7D2D1|nr:GNAT family N-acetyltransferase [Aestuariivita sp.]
MTDLPMPVPAHPSETDVAALLRTHLDLMRAASPPESCHVMDPVSLVDAKAQLFALRADQDLLGICALVMISPDHGEIKSMHTAAVARGRGVARALLRHVIGVARDAGVSRLSLETGSDDALAPARALYLAEGFAECPPFGSYVVDPLSVYMTRLL